MEMLVRRVVVVVVCLSLGNAAAQSVTGRCCAASWKGGSGGGGGGGCPGAPSGSFVNLPPITPEVENVSWETQDLHCPPTQTVVYYDLHNDSNHLTLFGDEVELALMFQPRDLFRKMTREYCVEVHGEGYRVAVCQPDPEKMCDNAICIPKCCGEGEVVKDFACTQAPGNMSLQFYSFNGKPLAAPSSVVMVGDMLPDCGDDGFPSFRQDTSHIHLLTSGKLLERDVEILHEFNHYCIDDMYLNDVHTPLYLTCSEPESTAIVIKHYLQKVGYVISVIFLLATILFHILIPSLQDTQGLCLISHMVSMGVAYIFFFILSQSSYGISWGFCMFSGFVLEFAFLAMFFWLNVMCFDIWRVIRDTAQGIPLVGILNNDAKKFRFYSLYGWGGPLVVTVVAAIMHTLPEEYAKNITPPGFGKETCWLGPGDMELLLYCYAYVAILFILDLGFIGHAMFMLFQAGSAFTCFTRQVSVTAFNRKHLEAFWQRFSLFIIMVLCWTTEILSWKIPPRELWIVTDALNATQGLLVFIIFISSKKRRDLVKDLLKKVPLPRSKSATTTTPLTTTGQMYTTYTSNVNSPSSSISGPSTSTTEAEISSQEVQSLSKTDNGENK